MKRYLKKENKLKYQKFFAILKIYNYFKNREKKSQALTLN